jgi:hypothetical protein
MEGGAIAAGEFHIPEGTMMGVRTPIKKEIRGNRTPSAGVQEDLTPPEVIVDTVAIFKRKNVSYKD